MRQHATNIRRYLHCLSAASKFYWSEGTTFQGSEIQQWSVYNILYLLTYSLTDNPAVISIFVNNWKAKGQAPRVLKILEVNLTRKGKNAYDAYRYSLLVRYSVIISDVKF